MQLRRHCTGNGELTKTKEDDDVPRQLRRTRSQSQWPGGLAKPKLARDLEDREILTFQAHHHKRESATTEMAMQPPSRSRLIGRQGDFERTSH